MLKTGWILRLKRRNSRLLVICKIGLLIRVGKLFKKLIEDGMFSFVGLLAIMAVIAAGFAFVKMNEAEKSEKRIKEQTIAKPV